MPALRFDNRFVRELPADPERGPRIRQVPGAAFSHVEPTPVKAPRLIAHSREVAQLLGLTEEDIGSPAFARVFGGNALLEGMQPYAANYGGHQFGNWAGQLGDGRAITLGEAINAQGERWELQLKGAGPTPYSRHADGRAVLRSSVREFLCSEAMHHLGVPTTRALCLVATGEAVERDMFYDGHPQMEPGAVVCRVAPSFLRFGNFELPASREEREVLEKLVDFCIDRDFPELTGGSTAERRAHWFAAIAERTAFMVAHWVRVGFVHGVMNTDNMSILGLTIDYGPYGWIDDYDPDWTPNTTDRDRRRYRFGQQPQVAFWNLTRLAGALAPLFPDLEPLQQGLEKYAQGYAHHDRAFAAAKLGLRDFDEEDAKLQQDMHALMHAARVDMTLWHRDLAELDLQQPRLSNLREAFYDHEAMHAHHDALEAWLRRYAERARRDNLEPGERRAAMNAANPRYVLRNYLAQQAIERAVQGDEAGIAELLDVLRRPYDEQPGREAYAARRPDWARDRPGCSMLSCSS
jgi:uncharacterized protein YdiU (UPF0061 family)